MKSVRRYIEAKAPVNIAVIKYWGKKDGSLKIPINDSLSGTLNMDDMCTTTSVLISDELTEDVLILNDQEQELGEKSPAAHMLKRIRSITPQRELLNYKVRIISKNNFPTAAGLASSAAGYACLAYALGHAYGVKDEATLSRIARNGSGSACRSLFGGFVHWISGTDDESSVAKQVVDEKHWPEMRVVICVINDCKKEVSSSSGMARSVETSPLIRYRAQTVVPQRIEEMKSSISNRDFQEFSRLTMQDSNQFHAICLDTFPPIFYLNETSRRIINICHLINSSMGTNKLAYTFDAGPNACVYMLDDFVPIFIGIMEHFFPSGEYDNDSDVRSLIDVKGRSYSKPSDAELGPILELLNKSGVKRLSNSVKYLINTSIGSGPKVVAFSESSPPE